MKAELLQQLRCPKCGAPFRATTLAEDAREIRAAHLFCAGDRHFFEVRDGIVRLGAGFQHELVQKEIDYENSTYHGDPRLTDPAIVAQFPETLPDLWPHTAHFGPDFAALIDKLDLRPGMWVLDIGTGPCWSCRLLAQKGANVIALDVNDAKFYGLGNADLLFETHDVHFERILESMTHLPLADNCIDRITFNASLHHTPDLKRSLAECARVLKPGGVVAMVNEEFASLRHRLTPAGDCHDTGSHHEIPYRDFERAARAADFKIKYYVAEHVRAKLGRKLPSALARVAVKILEACPPLLRQLNSALILLTKSGAQAVPFGAAATLAKPMPPAVPAAAPAGVTPGQAARQSQPEAAPPILMMGVPFDNVTKAQTIGLIEKMVVSGKPHHLVTANVDFLTQAQNDVELHRILTDAHLVLCDGTPLVWASRLLGNPLPERVAGSDLAPLLIKEAAQKGYRLYFLGGAPGSTGRAVERLRRQWPELNIVGHDCPPFAPLLEMDHEEICRKVRAARPDLLLVAFGCPKQEKWISMHYRSLGVPVVVGVGATIDFLAGSVRRAPVWMQQAGLEWVFRLLQEPRRLFGRYAHDLATFSTEILRQWWLMQWKAQRAAGRSKSGRPEWRKWEQAAAAPGACLLDLSRLRGLDSTEAGVLLRLQRQARREHKTFVLVAPSPAVRSALALMRLDTFFTFASDLPAARRLAGAGRRQSPVEWRQNYYPSKPSVFWRGEITVANASQVWESTEDCLARRGKTAQRLLIDASAVEFIDSAGACLMKRARQVAARLGLEIVFTGLGPNVLNVLRLSRMEADVLGASQ